MNARTVAWTSAAVFAFVALMHLWRVVTATPVVVGATAVPQSLSVLAVIVAGLLGSLNVSVARRASGSGSGRPERVAGPGTR